MWRSSSRTRLPSPIRGNSFLPLVSSDTFFWSLPRAPSVRVNQQLHLHAQLSLYHVTVDAPPPFFPHLWRRLLDSRVMDEDQTWSFNSSSQLHWAVNVPSVRSISTLNERYWSSPPEVKISLRVSSTLSYISRPDKKRHRVSLMSAVQCLWTTVEPDTQHHRSFKSFIESYLFQAEDIQNVL